MQTRDELITSLRGTPKGVPPLDQLQAMLAADPTLRCVVAYARISFDGRNKDAHGVEDQHQELADKAPTLNWLVVYRYTDNDKSASKENVVRDDFEQMLTDLTAGKTPEGYPIHGVMAVNDDRLYRRPGDWERYLRAFTSQEERVYYDSNGVQDLYAEGFEVKGLLGVAMSLAETRKKQRRSRANHRSRALRGRSTAAWRPFGWDDDKVSLRPDEAEAVRNAVRDVVAGASLSEIVRRWNDAGFKTSRGNFFKYQTVRQILLNPRLCGYREIKGELVHDSDGLPVVGEWSAIVEPKDWFAVVSQIRRRGSAQGAGIPRGRMVAKYLLTGILRCGTVLDNGAVCNNKMNGVKANSWVLYDHGYQCRGSGREGCSGTFKRGDKTDEYVQQLVIEKLSREAAAAARHVPNWGREQELSDALQRRATLEEKWQKGIVGDEIFFRNLSALENIIKELRADQARNLVMKAAAEESIVDIREAWASKTLVQRRKLIQKCLIAVVARPSGKGNKPFDVELLTPVWRSSSE